MGKRQSYAPGTFCAVDLETSDADGAKRFYGELFGWDSEDVSPGEGMIYTILRLDGDAVGGLYEPPAERRDAGIPPHWVPYFAVESLEATLERCRELGGAKVFGPMEMPTGRIAALRDPQGAIFAIWEGELED